MTTSPSARPAMVRATPIRQDPGPNSNPQSNLPPSPHSAHDLVLASRGVIDLRRPCGRESRAVLCERAALLDPADRVLVESVFRDGRTLFELARAARAADGPDASPPRLAARCLARRLKRAVARMTSPLFVFVAARAQRALELGETPAWPVDRRRIGDLVVLRGRSLRSAAADLGISVHRAREHLRAIEAMYGGAAS